MNRIIRKSNLQDSKEFIKIKTELPLPTGDENSADGGFLLGTNLDTYNFYIEKGFCLSAVVENKVVGFGILLPDYIIKQSELWEKRKLVSWDMDIMKLEKSNISYLEQLAFLKGHKRLSILLAYHLVKEAFKNGSDYVLTTTVRKPVLNTAALPFIKAAGGKLIGNIDEFYPIVGNINSDIYIIGNNNFIENVKLLPVAELLKLSELK